MKSSLSHFVLALIVFLSALMGYVWWYGQVSSLSAQVASLEQEIETKTESAKRAGAVGAALEKLESNQNSVQSYFVSENNIVVFLGELEKMGADLGAKVSVASVGAPAAKGNQMLTVSLTISGTFDAVMRTIGAVEQAPYAILITSVNMTSSGDGKVSQWSASVSSTVGSVAQTK